MDPLGTGDDGLALDDSTQSFEQAMTDLNNNPPALTGSTNPNDSGNFFAPASGSGSASPSFGPSPPNGLNGSTTPNFGSILGTIGGALGLTSAFQSQQQQLSLAGQSPLQRFGLTDANGQLTQSGQMIIFGGLALVAFMILRK